MAALTADRNTQRKPGELLPFKLAAGVKIFAGSLVCANASGFAVPGSTAATLTYLGRAEETVEVHILHISMEIMDLQVIITQK